MPEFREQNKRLPHVPEWAQALIDFGYYFRAKKDGKKRIAIVTMPCDSPAAGLIALGALVQDLSDPQATDVQGHYDSLLNYAKQYLNACKTCELRQCDPRAKGCGYIQKSTGVLRSRNSPTRRFYISDQTSFEKGQLAVAYYSKSASPMVQKPGKEVALDFYPEGGVASVIHDPNERLPASVYEQIFPGVSIKDANLSQSYSGLCLAGRSSGERATRCMLSNFSFVLKQGEFSINDVLTISPSASARRASRMTFFNARSRDFDRFVYSPSFVVSDGCDSLQRVRSNPAFQEAHIVAVVSRLVDREKKKDLAQTVASLEQWYQEDEKEHEKIATKPAGIGMLVLEKRF